VSSKRLMLQESLVMNKKNPLTPARSGIFDLVLSYMGRGQVENPAGGVNRMVRTRGGGEGAFQNASLLGFDAT
jgi:hypothetical protein